MTDAALTYWRAVLAPIGVPTEIEGSPMLGNGAVIGFTAPRPLRAVLGEQGPIEVIGTVDLFAADAGEPRLLVAAGTITTDDPAIVERLGGDDVHCGFDLADVVGMGGVIMAGTFNGATIMFEPPGTSYSSWPSVTRFELSQTRVTLTELTDG